mmetsp:Transcript_2560/g.8159  ORF Transcript_2560/g.8159 Transcript_2560/m.8159 type:complete len:497 (-) Transcript_2560:82-1572(-)
MIAGGADGVRSGSRVLDGVRRVDADRSDSSSTGSSTGSSNASKRSWWWWGTRSPSPAPASSPAEQPSTDAPRSALTSQLQAAEEGTATGSAVLTSSAPPSTGVPSSSPTLASAALSVSPTLSASLSPPPSLALSGGSGGGNWSDEDDGAASGTGDESDGSSAGSVGGEAEQGGSASSRYAKDVRPTQEMLVAMHLKPGRNTLQFTVRSTLQGVKQVSASLYLWDSHAKIVISDIDGTITRSDVMGHVLPTLGRDWSHAGVARLYQSIAANDYKLLYLTSRPIGHAKRTRGYISSLRQSEDTLPEGPVLMSPDRLLTSLHNEVIAKRADVFKLSALSSIRSLFPPSHFPYYAGFGNRHTDVKAYTKVGLPRGKVFIINYEGQISISNRTFSHTYGSMHELVDAMFPPVRGGAHRTVGPGILSGSDEEGGEGNSVGSAIATAVTSAVSAVVPAVSAERASSSLFDEGPVDVEDRFNSFQYWSVPLRDHARDKAFMADQ